MAEECEQANSLSGERVSEACSTVEEYMFRITQVVEQADLTIQEQANKLYDVLCDLEEMKCLKQSFCDFGNHIGDISSINGENTKRTMPSSCTKESFGAWAKQCPRLWLHMATSLESSLPPPLATTSAMQGLCSPSAVR